MVLTKEEFLASLQNEVRILLHLAGKIDRDRLDYRPSSNQRSTLELLRYLTFMGPTMIAFARAGAFDPQAWQAAAAPTQSLSFEQTLAALEKLKSTYATQLQPWSDEDFRGEVEMLGSKSTRGAFLVHLVLSAHAAYRTQLFLYLKACGRSELNTMNLWAGMDSPPAAA